MGNVLEPLERSSLPLPQQADSSVFWCFFSFFLIGQESGLPITKGKVLQCYNKRDKTDALVVW